MSLWSTIKHLYLLIYLVVRSSVRTLFNGALSTSSFTVSNFITIREEPILKDAQEASVTYSEGLYADMSRRADEDYEHTQSG